MAFHPIIKRKIVRDRKTEKHLPCVMCGTEYPLPDAVHIIDEKEWKERVGCDRQANGIPLCPNCHRVFDEVLRPYLYRALEGFGATALPVSWKKNNKITVTEQELGLEDQESSE
jgi:predicted restriction endonuclease